MLEEEAVKNVELYIVFFGNEKNKEIRGKIDDIDVIST